MLLAGLVRCRALSRHCSSPEGRLPTPLTTPTTLAPQVQQGEHFMCLRHSFHPHAALRSLQLGSGAATAATPLRLPDLFMLSGLHRLSVQHPSLGSSHLDDITSCCTALTSLHLGAVGGGHAQRGSGRGSHRLSLVGGSGSIGGAASSLAQGPGLALLERLGRLSELQLEVDAAALHAKARSAMPRLASLRHLDLDVAADAPAAVSKDLVATLQAMRGLQGLRVRVRGPWGQAETAALVVRLRLAMPWCEVLALA